MMGLNNILIGKEHTLVNIYTTMSCETGSDSKRKAYIKVISCCFVFKSRISRGHTNVLYVIIQEKRLYNMLLGKWFGDGMKNAFFTFV